MEDFQKNYSTIISGKLIKNLSSEQLKNVSLPRLAGDPSVNPDLCLSRKDMIDEDKKKKFLHMFSSKTPRDISHILDTHSKTSQKINIPVVLSDMRKIMKVSKTRNPTSIKETESIEKWLQDIVKSELPEMENILISRMTPDHSFIEKAESIYSIALNEVVRQVSVQCKSRAELLKHIIETLATLWKKYPDYLLYICEKDKKKHLEELETLDLSHKAHLKKFQDLLESHKSEIALLQSDLREKEEENEKLKQFISSTSWEYEEFIINKSKKLKMESVQCQTDFMPDLSSSEESAESDSFTDSSYSTLHIAIPKSHKAVSPNLELEQERQNKFKQDLSLLLENLDPPVETDFQALAEMALTEDNNCESWLFGFKTAVDLLQKSRRFNQIRKSPQVQLSAEKAKEKTSLIVNTKFKVQPFNRKNTSRTLNDSSVLTPRDSINVSNVIAGITSQPASKLAKFTKSSYKKLSNHVDYYINLAISKKFSKNSKFSEFLFLKFIEKYNIKSLAERKFQEMITGCLLYTNENPKFSWFLRALNAGKSPEMPELSQEGTEMFVRIHEFMINSRIGVLPDSANPLQNKLFPYLRVLECIRCKFELILPKSDFAGLIEQSNKLVVPDPTTINKAGLVDLDRFVDVSMEIFERFVQRIKTGAVLCIKIVTDYNYLTKGQVNVVLRHICPHKYLQFIKSLDFDEQNLIGKDDFIENCVFHGVLSSAVVSEFFAGYDKNVKQILDYIDRNETKILELAKTIEDSLTPEEWENYFFDLRVKLKCSDLTKYLQLWHMLKKEIDYISVI